MDVIRCGWLSGFDVSKECHAFNFQFSVTFRGLSLKNNFVAIYNILSCLTHTHKRAHARAHTHTNFKLLWFKAGGSCGFLSFRI